MGAGKRGQTKTVSVDALLDRAVVAHGRGDLAETERLCRKVLAHDATEPGAAQLLGAVLSERDEAEDAIELFDAVAPRVGDIDALNLGFYNNYANALRRGKRYGQAEVILRKIVGVDPRGWHAWHNLGQSLKDAERYDEAIAPLRRAVALAPEHGPNHAVLGEVLYHLGRLRSAEASLRKCIELGWDTDVNLWTLLGNTERLLGKLPDAIECLERALALSNGSAAAHSNLSIAYAQVGRFDDAVEQVHTSIKLDRENDIMHSNASYVLLTAGEIVEGWDEWEWGLLGPRGSERPTHKTRWTPEHRAGRVLCYREQGVGDEILFASCYPDLIETAHDVVIESDPRLATLFGRSFPTAEVRAQTFNLVDGETMHDYDYAIPAGSLPQHFRNALDQFPDRPAFLVADPERVAAWKTRLAEIGPGPLVGMSWRSRVKTAERRLEYTQLDQWGELFAIPGINWINLQYDDCERDLLAAQRKFGVTIHRWDWLDLMNDFEEVAALMTCLDLVVSPRSAVAMLGGGLGAPTVMMGNRWDWSDLGSDTSPWFPQVRLVYRHVGEEWDAVLATAAASVRAVASSIPLIPKLDEEHLMLDLNGSTILLTGGTGSFGHAFVERVTTCWPDATLRVYSRDELKQSEMRTRFGDGQIRYLIGDVRDRSRMTAAVEGADIVVHAAAMKQVPAREYNPFEAVRTNVLGAQHVVDAAIDARVRRVVALSTDKAVNPVNLYGATKLCAEKIFVQGNAYAAQRQTRIACVRYGNVVGSRGSVVPVFRDQLARNGRITITDERMTRFWITLPKAVDLVLHALDNMEGGEIFIPKIPSMRVTDLAEALAPGAPQDVIGIRPGEKLHELMITSDEARHTIDAGDVYLVMPEHPWWDEMGPSAVGIPCADDFVYASDTNDEWLSIEELREVLDVKVEAPVA